MKIRFLRYMYKIICETEVYAQMSAATHISLLS